MLFVVQVIFATLPIASKLILPVIDPLGIAALRIFGAALGFAALKWGTRRPGVTAPRDLLALFGLSLLGVVLNQVLFMEGMQRTTAIHANILITTIPVFTLVIALLLGRERASALKWTGIALSGSGAAYLVLARGGAAAGATLLGDVLVVVNTVFYAAYLVLSKDLLKRYDPITVVTYVFLFGALIVAPFGLPALARVPAEALTSHVLLVLGYIIVFTSFLTYLLSIWALKRAQSSLVAMYVYVQPVVTAVLAPLVLGERVTPRAGLASLVIFAGLVLATRPGRVGLAEVV